MITINSSKMKMTNGEISFSKEELLNYIEDEIIEVLSLFGAEKKSEVLVTLRTEGKEHDPVQKVDIKVKIKGKTINQSAHSRSIKKAIDRAIPDLKRQIKKLKTKQVDKRRNSNKQIKHLAPKLCIIEEYAFEA